MTENNGGKKTVVIVSSAEITWSETTNQSQEEDLSDVNHTLVCAAHNLPPCSLLLYS